MSIKTKIVVAVIIAFLISLTNFSCNPHRSGHTAKQMGAGSDVKYHTKPASAKKQRRLKY